MVLVVDTVKVVLDLGVIEIEGGRLPVPLG